MLEILSQFFAVTLSAIVVENAFFSRALSTSESFIIMKGRKQIFFFCSVVTLITTISGLFTWLINWFTRPKGVSIHLRSLLFLCAICICYLCLCAVLHKNPPKEYARIKDVLTVAAFNSAVFGSLLLAAMQNYTLLNTLGYGLGTGIGLSLAMLLVWIGQRSMALCNVPRAFTGLPISLIYIGVLSLAIYGLIGHQLPY